LEGTDDGETCCEEEREWGTWRERKWRFSKAGPRSPLKPDGERNRNTMASSLLSELEQMAAALGQEGATVENSLLEVGAKIAKELGVNTDEVAILAVSTRWRHLHFLVPQPLKNVGFIPLTSNSALAARTVRESRPEINNNFSGVRHATVFEGVRTATTSGESIHKIISAPILYEGKVVGVMQISRKGTSKETCGPDFTAEDLGKVLAYCRPLGRLVQHFGGE